MEKIPTAEEFMLENLQSMDQTEVEHAMIEFAKLHVEAALKAASDVAFSDSKYDVENSYPLENIK